MACFTSLIVRMRRSIWMLAVGAALTQAVPACNAGVDPVQLNPQPLPPAPDEGDRRESEKDTSGGNPPPSASGATAGNNTSSSSGGSGAFPATSPEAPDGGADGGDGGIQ